jgi:hypothetical protein
VVPHPVASGARSITPQHDDVSFDDWWANSNDRVSSPVQKGLNSIIILGAWAIWNHRSRCVFYGILPSLNEVMFLIKEELHLWCLVGARGVSYLLALAPSNI